MELIICQGNAFGDGKPLWRGEWDSNPRYLSITSFQDWLLKPLGHLRIWALWDSNPGPTGYPVNIWTLLHVNLFHLFITLSNS